MKKLLLSIATLALGFTAYAGEVTFDFTAENAAQTYGFPPYSVNEATGEGQADYITVPKEITSGPVVIILEGKETTDNSGAWRIWNDGLRQYKSQNAQFTVTTNNGEKITGVTWTVSSNDVSFAEEGTEENITAWTGESEGVTFVSTSTKNNGVKTITVTYGDTSLEIPTLPEPSADVIDVAEALELIEAGYTGEATVEGVIIEITEVETAQYGNATYTIADNATDTEGLKIFRGYWLGGAKFTSEDQLEVGAEVIVKGSLMNYQNTTPEMAQGNVILSYNGETAQEPEPVEGIIYNEPFSTGLGEFTIVDDELPEALTYVWSFDSQYGAKASAYANSMCYAAEAWLVSPAIDLEGYSNVTLSLSHAINKANGEPVTDFCNVYVGEAGTEPSTEWTNISSEIEWPAGDNWTFVDVEGVSLAAFEGKKIQVGFLYSSTAEVAPTWEIKNFLVAGDADNGAVEGIDADINAPVYFYNLQGMKVNNPENGIFIRRQGSKTTKVIIR
ncbi:MAG: choice-of-anchor J domain-containing protein [Muribaculaceae bacterium]|nr:choice-of-anchor J domain-containing protein [Muribaculaceae bacterium]